MKEGRVVTWLKAEGDEIEAGEAIMVVESDKADMDVEAFEDGYLAKILTQEGETAEVGAVVALVAALQGDIASIAEGGGDAAPAAPAAATAIVADASPAAAGGECFREMHMDLRMGGRGKRAPFRSIAGGLDGTWAVVWVVRSIIRMYMGKGSISTRFIFQGRGHRLVGASMCIIIKSVIFVS